MAEGLERPPTSFEIVNTNLKTYIEYVSTTDNDKRLIIDEGSEILALLQTRISSNYEKNGSDALESKLTEWISIATLYEYGRKSSNNHFKNVLAVLQLEISKIVQEVSVEENNNAETKTKTKLEFLPSLIPGDALACPHCPRVMDHFQSLQRHVRVDHKGLPGIKSSNFKQEKTICLMPKKSGELCNAVFNRIDTCRHLQKVHKEEKPNGKIFKGFYRCDDGHLPHIIAWASQNETIPTIQYLEIPHQDILESAVEECQLFAVNDSVVNEPLQEGPIYNDVMIAQSSPSNAETDLQAEMETSQQLVNDEEIRAEMNSSFGIIHNSSDGLITFEFPEDEQEMLSEQLNIKQDDHVSNVHQNDLSIDEDETDSDYMSEDDEQFTKIRRENKRKRREKRSTLEATKQYYEYPENADFIEKFSTWTSNTEPTVSQAISDDDVSTIRGNTNYLFTAKGKG